MNIKNINKTKLFFLAIICAELLSLLGHLFPMAMKLIFLIFIALAFVFSLYNLKYLIYFIFVELIIGSKGYLFYFDFNNFTLSLRISLWLIAMSFWLSKIFIDYKNNKLIFKNYASLNFFYSKYFKYYLYLFVFILLGLVNGYLRQNQIDNIFFDFNGWLYFFLILPLFMSITNNEDKVDLLHISYLSTIWVCIKTLILLFVFSHYTATLSAIVYKWVRTTGVGEITLIQNGFYRIFFQSHIFALIGFFIIFYLILSDTDKLKNIIVNKPLQLKLIFLNLCMATILLSFSRSFWLAGLLSSIIFLFLVFKKYNFKKVIQASIIFFFTFAICFFSIVAIAKFPYPKTEADFSASSLFSQRAKQFSSESAVSSRWNLLPEVLSKIKNNFFVGGGFGATVTYKSSDPRVLESTADGLFTTYAFEWGWLDVWLKLGLLGLITYLLLLFRLTLKKNTGNGNDIVNGLNLGILILVLVSVFSPYLNHPLGIGYLIFVTLWFNNDEKNNTLAIK